MSKTRGDSNASRSSVTPLDPGCNLETHSSNLISDSNLDLTTTAGGVLSVVPCAAARVFHLLVSGVLCCAGVGHLGATVWASRPCIEYRPHMFVGTCICHGHAQVIAVRPQHVLVVVVVVVVVVVLVLVSAS